jgi:hypothetical protein
VTDDIAAADAANLAAAIRLGADPWFVEGVVAEISAGCDDEPIGRVLAAVVRCLADLQRHSAQRGPLGYDLDLHDVLVAMAGRRLASMPLPVQRTAAPD